MGKKCKKPWIVDLGASDHMTGDATIFGTYSPCTNNLKVRIVDGSLSKVTGTCSVVLSKDLTLNSIIPAPNLECNLLSISKVTKENMCVINFPPLTVNFKIWIWIWGRRLALLRNALNSTSSRSTTIQKNNLKRQLMVILFLFLVKITIVKSCYGTIA